MKLNYLLPDKEANEPCDGSITKLKKHVWVPGGQIRKSLDGSVGAEFFCKRCERRYWHFFNPDEYEIFKNLLEVAA